MGSEFDIFVISKPVCIYKGVNVRIFLYYHFFDADEYFVYSFVDDL